MRIEIRRLLLNTQALGVLVLLMSLIPVMPTAVQAQNTENNRRSAVHAMTFTQLQDKFYKTEIKKKISVDLHEMTVEQALREIARETGLRLSYRGDIMVDKMISLQKKNITVSDALANILDNTGLDYKISQDGYLLITETENLLDEIFQETITGTVTDSQTGEALPGVNVIVVGSEAETGTIVGTTTDEDGFYEIEVPESLNTIAFSYIGYLRTEINIDGRNTINVELNPDITGLDELVVVGYGTQRKSDITGSVGIATADDLEQPTFNALQSLRGKVSGVNIFTNSGSPTGSSRVVIRGIGTINASSDPLYVVDGVVMDDIDTMNPNNIESIEVLKDASATAIYGSRGANGVILITTARGGSDGLSVSYNGDISFGHLRKKMDAMNSEEFMEVQRIAYQNAPLFQDYAPGEEPQLILSDLLFDEQGNPRYDTDWQEEATRTAVSNNHQLSVQSGGDNSSYGAFLNYTNQEGIFLNSFMERINAKLVYDASPKDWLTLGTNLSVTSTSENDVLATGGGHFVSRTINEYAPIFPVKWDDGTYSNSTQTGDGSIRFPGQPNPVHRLLEEDRLRDNFQLFGNTYLEFQILSNLNFRTQYGLNKNKTEFREYGPTNMVSVGFPEGNATVVNSETDYWQSENYLTFQENYESFRLNAVLGISWQERSFKSNSITVRGFPDDFFRFNNLGAATEVETPSSVVNEWSMNSYFTRINYTYNDTYSATFTGRIDGSSRFGKNNKYGYFPSGGLSWLVSNEEFMNNVNFVDNLRLRTSYGITGNTEIGYYQSLATIGSGTVLIDGNRVSSSGILRLANPDLEWEKTKQFDAGIEFSVFNQSLTFQADYYFKLTDDLILDRPIPTSTGFGTISDNIGSVSNRGVDLSISTRNVQSSNFNWTTSLNVNFNRNKVESLGANDEDIFPGPNWVSGSQTILRVGEPIGSFWGFERLGTWGTDEAEEAASVGALPGEAKRSEEKKIIGNGMPDFSGSLINRFFIGNFDAVVDFQFVYGSEIMQQFLHSAEDRMAHTNGLATQLHDSWTPDNQNTMIQRIRHTQLSGQNTVTDSHWVVDGSYLRANLFSVGYSLNDNQLSKIAGVQNLRINLSVENAFVIHDKGFKGYDPEGTSWTGLQGEHFTQNIFFFQYPRPRTITLGLNVQF